MSVLRAVIAALAVSLALVLQVSVLSQVSYDGVVPNLVLLVVVGAALTRGTRFAMGLGFAAGVLLDLAPPADHLAGRWALALVVVGYVAGRARSMDGADERARATRTSAVLTVVVSSFVGTSLFALSGLLLRDPLVAVPDLLRVVGIGVGLDLLLTPFVMPPLLAMFRRLEPARVRA